MSVRRALLVQIAVPLLVLGGAAWVVLHSTRGGDAAIAREEARLTARLGSKADRAALQSDLRDFAFLHRKDEDAVRFALRTLARLHALKAMAETWGEDPERARRPGAAKAFARDVLPLLARDTDDPTQPSWMFPRAMQALVEAGDAKARADLKAFIETMAPEWTLAIYAPMSRTPSAARDVAAAALAARTAVPEMAAAGYTMRAHPGDRRDVEAMRKLVASDMRQRAPPFWQRLVRALGNAGGVEEAKFLGEVRASLAGDALEMRVQRQSVDVGLALTGDSAAADRVLASITPVEEVNGVNWAIGLSTRLAHGDRSAAAPLKAIWERGGDVTHLQLGMGVLLADPEPPDDLPCDEWADAL